MKPPGLSPNNKRIPSKSSRALALLVMVFIWIGTPTTTQALTFEQPLSGAGTITMDAAHFDTLAPSHDGYLWQTVNTTEAVDNSALQAPLNAQPISAISSNARVDYSINFTQTGSYRLWIRGFSADGNSDTLYVGLNGTPLSSAFFRIAPYQTWTWTDKIQGGGYFNISINNPGIHSLNLWMRESGLIVDRIVLIKNAAFIPTGDGPSETPISGGDPQPDTNQPPTLTPISAKTVTVGHTLSFVAQASDSDSGVPSLSATGLPSGAYFADQGIGSANFNWTPTAGDIGQHQITITATDAVDPAVTSQIQVSITVEAAAGSGTGASSGSVFDEAAGLVSIEAEHFSTLTASADNSNWQVINNSNAVGNSALQAPIDAQSQSSFLNNARADYNINFSQAGTYHLWMRGYSANGNSDTLYVGIDGTPLSSAFLRIAPYATWLWTDKIQGGGYFNITINTPGVHTLNLWMRETGLIVDRIVLSKDSNLTPSGDGPAESSRSGASSNEAPTLAAVADQTVTAGDTINFEIQANDSDSAAPSLSVNNLPSGASFIDMGSGVGEFEWITSDAAVGEHLVTFIATDAEDAGLTAEIQVTLTVEAADPGTGGSDGTVYDEAGGLVAMEAEHYSQLITSVDGHQWNSINSTEAIAGSALQAPLTAEPQSSVTSNARVDYKINFSQAGTYHLWMRGYSPNGSSDTLYVGLNGSPISSAFFRIAPYQTWTWTDKIQGGGYLNVTVASPGQYTFNLWMRETGLIVDRIVLSRNSALTPSGDGPAESTRSGDTNTDPGTDPEPESIAGYTHYWQLNESNGSKYYNRIGGSAECTDCPSSEAGPFKQTLNFNGSNDILVSAYDSRLAWAANKSITIEAWIKHSSNCQAAEAVIGRNDSASGMRWWLGCNDGKVAFVMVDSNGNSSGMLSSTTDINDNQWHHIAVVKDGFDRQNRLYVDGQHEASQNTAYSGSFVGNSRPLSIGGLLNTTSNFYFSGRIDELAIHDRALPEKTLRQHFADGNYGLHRGLVGCDAELKIMPLGDSNTRGNASFPRYSYRPYLYSNLDVAGYDVNFVGSLTDSYSVGFPFDHNHEGHSGFTPGQIANNVISWLSSNSAEIVLLHIGTNEHNVPDVETILDYIDLVDEDIIVVLAKIINEQTYNPATTEFNNQLEAMALARPNDKILIVDQESALNYVDDMSDNLHANNSGYVKMADVWYERLSEFLPVCQPVIPRIASASTHSIELGETLVLAMDHIGFPQPSFSLTSGPAGMKINPDTGVLSWTPNATGSYAVTVKAVNDKGQNSIGFTVEVE